MTGQEIKEMRIGLGWSQQKLGEYLGIEQATVSRLEADQWEPSGPVLKLLSMLGPAPAKEAAA